MKATIESTDRLVFIDAVDGVGKTRARVWEGVTDKGVPFVAYIPLMQVKRDEDNAEFCADLMEHKTPEPGTLRAIEARFIL